MESLRIDESVRAVVRRIAGMDVSLEIHPRDEMLEHAVELLGDSRLGLVHYVLAGRNASRLVEQIAEWGFGGLDHVGRLLDFAAGFGRVSRFLAQRMPRDRIRIGEIEPEAVRFQQTALGLEGFVSTVSAEELHVEERFDLILCASLFTHLPEVRFHAWLRRLVELLEPGGLLLLSANGPDDLPLGTPMPESGIHFIEHSESRRFDASEYGTTRVSEAFVRAAAERVGPDVSVWRFPRGWLNYQDLYLVSAGERDVSSLIFDPGAEGHVDEVILREPGRLTVRGWAIDRGARVEQVEVVIDGVAIAATGDFHDRPDVPGITGRREDRRSGWRMETDLPAAVDYRSSLLQIVVRSSGGMESTFYLGTIERGLVRTVDQLERLIRGMRESFFWKLRDRWFALKRRLGRTHEL